MYPGPADTSLRSNSGRRSRHGVAVVLFAVLLCLNQPLSAAADDVRPSGGTTCSIAGLVWNDGDGTGHGDGQIGLGEQGIGDVTVRLLQPNGDPVGGADARQTTDDTGRYQFAGLPCGSYRVQFPTFDNNQFTTPNVGPPATASAAVPDENGNGITGIYQLGGDQPADQAHVNAGMLQAESGNMQKIGDRVWRDTNGNGIQDTGEHGVPGVTVTLINPDGTSPGEGTEVVTNSDGRYLFTTLDIGTYRVRYSHLPASDHFTKPDAGREDVDSDALPASNDARTADTADVFVGSLPDESDNRTIDAGIRH